MLEMKSPTPAATGNGASEHTQALTEKHNTGAAIMRISEQSGIPSLIPPGIYEMAFVEFETRLMFHRAPKIIMWFCITEPGPAFGVKLARYYNAKRLIGKPGPDGAFAVGFRSDFLREYVLILHRAPRRLDRVPMSHWRNRIVRAAVDTVELDSRQRKIPELIRYSVVKEIVGLVQ